MIGILSKLFGTTNRPLTADEINAEKLRVKEIRDRQYKSEKDKKKREIIKKLKRSCDYYSRQSCPNRESRFSKHEIILGLDMAANPDYKGVVNEIHVECKFCGGKVNYRGGVTTIIFNDELCDINITEDDLKEV